MVVAAAAAFADNKLDESIQNVSAKQVSALKGFFMTFPPIQ